MFELLKNYYFKLESLKGKKLIAFTVVVFVIFLVIGLGLGYITHFALNKNEMNNFTSDVKQIPQTDIKTYEGKVVYINPNFYPQDKITYALTDSAGKEIILLSSKDQKLVVAEGNFVKVIGRLSKTSDGKKGVLFVDKVVIKNASN